MNDLRLTIKVKMIISFSLMVFIMISVSIYSYFTFKSFVDIENEMNHKSVLANKVIELIGQIPDDESVYILRPTEENKSIINMKFDEINQSIDVIQMNISDAKVEKALDSATRMIEYYEEQSDRLLDETNPLKMVEIQKVMKEDARLVQEGVQEYLSVELHYQDEIRLMLSEKKDQAGYIILAGFFLVTISFLASTLFIGRVTSPLVTMSKEMKKVSDGNWDIEIERNNAKDEVGILNESFIKMVGDLKASRDLLEKKVEERTAELKKAKDIAEEANKAKSVFLANMSHELRTPMNAILGFSEIIQSTEEVPTSIQEHLKVISRNGEHLLTLINDVLNLSKIEAGRTTFNPNSFDLYDLVMNIKSMFRLKAESKGIDIKINYDGDIPRYVYTDEIKLRQVLINLVGNSVKFTDHGYIDLQVVMPKEGKDEHERFTLEFQISDTGAGIGKDELHGLFDAFTQSAVGKKEEEGTGLGLTIAKQFVVLMGGDIKVESSLGEGSTFSFSIDVSKGIQPNEKNEISSRKILGLVGKQPEFRIMIVDDQKDNRLFLQEIMAPIGFSLKEAKNGQEAVNLWEEWKPHLIWMDMRMPVMDGLEATKRIKKAEELLGPNESKTIIIAATASVFEQEKNSILAAGCNDFVRKPFKVSTVFNMIEKYLDVKYKYDDNEALVMVTESVEKAKSQIHEISNEVFSDLEKAINELNSGEIERLVNLIKNIDNQLGSKIDDLVYDFKYDEIINLIRGM